MDQKGIEKRRKGRKEEWTGIREEPQNSTNLIFGVGGA